MSESCCYGESVYCRPAPLCRIPTADTNKQIVVSPDGKGTTVPSLDIPLYDAKTLFVFKALVASHYTTVLIRDLSTYLCLSADFRRCKPPGRRPTPDIAHLNGQIASVHNIFPNVSLICLPVIIYPSPWRYIAEVGVWDLAAPAKKDYRLVIISVIVNEGLYTTGVLMIYLHANNGEYEEQHNDEQCDVRKCLRTKTHQYTY